MGYEICTVSHLTDDKTGREVTQMVNSRARVMVRQLAPEVMLFALYIYPSSRMKPNSERRKIDANITEWRPLGVVLIGGRSIIILHSIFFIAQTTLYFADSQKHQALSQC